MAARASVSFYPAAPPAALSHHRLRAPAFCEPLSCPFVVPSQKCPIKNRLATLGAATHPPPVATAEQRTSLDKFASFARSLHGDEKSEAQGFLERFFRALGHEGVMEAGAIFEFRIAKKPGTAQLELIQGEGARAKARVRRVARNSPTCSGPSACSSR